MSYYDDSGTLMPDRDELELECEKCGAEFIALKKDYTDDEGFITGPFICSECEDNNE